MGTPQLKILVVDDEADARIGLSRMLRAKGYEVIELSRGGEVLQKAKSEWPALIILDIVLPDIPGTQVFKTLRDDPITKMIPVMLLTAKPDIVGEIPTFEQKSDRYFEKPGRMDELLDTVHQMLTGKK